MSKLPALSGRACIAVLQKLGFAIRRQHGSHVILRGDDPFCQVVVHDHRVLDRGTLRGILRQAGLSVEQFNELL